MKLSYINLPPLKLKGGAINLKYPLIKYKDKGQKLLYVADSLTREDMINGKFFASATGETVNRCFDHAVKIEKRKPQSILLTTTHVAKRGLSLSEKDRSINQRRIIARKLKLIQKYRPDTVILTSLKDWSQWERLGQIKLLGRYRILQKPENKDDLINFRGRLLPIRIAGHRCNLLVSLPPSLVASSNPKYFASAVQLLGMVVKDFQTAIRGYNTTELPLMKYKLIDNINDLKNICRGKDK